MDSDVKIALLMFAGMVIFVVSLVTFQANQERKTFNKFRAEGVPEATLGDAMWSELRIEANGK